MITHCFTVMVVVATKPLWSDLGRGRIVGILWSSDRNCCGWRLAQRGGWLCHGVIAWLTQANTNIGQSWIFYFSILINKTYTYYAFNMYMYYKRNTGSLWLRLDPTLSEKVFKPAHDTLKEIDP